MKITQEHYEYMRAAICANSKAPTLDEYTRQGLSARRWRWDLLWGAGLSSWLCKVIYPYANDEHVDTVLRQITGTK